MKDLNKVIIIAGIILLALVIISIIVMFLTAANSKSEDINSATDTAVIITMEKEINEILSKVEITGTEAKKVIEYFKGNSTVRVDLVNTKTNSISIPQNFEDISSQLDREDIQKVYKNIKSTQKFKIFTKKLSAKLDNIIITQK